MDEWNGWKCDISDSLRCRVKSSHASWCAINKWDNTVSPIVTSFQCLNFTIMRKYVAYKFISITSIQDSRYSFLVHSGCIFSSWFSAYFRSSMKKFKLRRRNFVESETWTLTNLNIAFYFSKVTFAFSRYNLLPFNQVCNLRFLVTYLRSMHWYQYLSIEEINLTLNSLTDLKTKWPLILWPW